MQMMCQNGHSKLNRQIVDGDTFHVITKLNSKEPLHQYSLRLIGMDAPEMKPHLSNPMHDLQREAAIYVRDQLRALSELYL